jgi:threonine dehydratase
MSEGSHDGSARPILRDVLRARTVVHRYLRPTPLLAYPALDAATGLTLYVKHENHQPIGAFKVRGGIYLLSRLSEEERQRGVAVASTGNHGQSIAYAARVFGAPAIVGVPEGANPGKIAAMRALGATVIEHGADFSAARDHIEALAAERGWRYIHHANEPDLIAGVGTIALEILAEMPDIDVILTPVGGGSGAAGACIVAKSVDPRIAVIAVGAANAPAGYLTWKERRPVATGPVESFAEGLATRDSSWLTREILWDLLDDFVTVSEEEMAEGVRLLLTHAHTLAEGAGAAPLAAALKLRDRLAGRRVAIVLTGGNISPAQLRTILAG